MQCISRKELCICRERNKAAKATKRNVKVVMMNPAATLASVFVLGLWST